MGENAYCDACGAVGRRRRGQISPKGWWYAIFLSFDGGGEPNPDDESIVYACSDACKKVPWKEGPGDTESMRTHRQPLHRIPAQMIATKRTAKR